MIAKNLGNRISFEYLDSTGFLRTSRLLIHDRSALFTEQFRQLLRSARIEGLRFQFHDSQGGKDSLSWFRNFQRTGMPMKEELSKAAISLGARHFRIWEWINGHFTSLISKSRPLKPKSLQQLWQLILREEIRDGRRIEFVSNPATDTYWYLHEWVPRAPGALWLQDRLLGLDIDKLSCAFDLNSCPRNLLDLMYCEHCHWEAQFRVGRSLEAQGFNYRAGIYRPPLGSDDDKYALLSLVSAKEFFTDLAFPILISKEVYRKFISEQIAGNAVEVECSVEIQEAALSDPFKSYIRAVGGTEERKLAQLICEPLGRRALFGYVVSPLSMTVRGHNSHPTGTLRIEGHNGYPLTKRAGILFIQRSLVANPKDLPNTMTHADFLLGFDHQFSTEMKPLTDFDARIRRFTSSMPIRKNPTTIKELHEKFHESVL